jgi:hypothetical protein
MPCRRRRNRPSRLAWRRRPGPGLRAGGPLRPPAQGIRPSARPSRARARPGSRVGAAWLTASLPTTSPVSRWTLSLTGPIGAIRDLPELRLRDRFARNAALADGSPGCAMRSRRLGRARDAMSLGAQLDLAGVIGRRARGRLTGTRRPPSVTSPASWPWRPRSGRDRGGPSADDLVDLGLHQLIQHSEPDTDAERQQPVLGRAGELSERLPHAPAAHSRAPRRGDRRGSYGPYKGLALLSSLDVVGACHGPSATGRGGRTAVVKFYGLRDTSGRGRPGVVASGAATCAVRLPVAPRILRQDVRFRALDAVRFRSLTERHLRASSRLVPTARSRISTDAERVCHRPRSSWPAVERRKPCGSPHSSRSPSSGS